jgi:hypothetical protein
MNRLQMNQILNRAALIIEGANTASNSKHVAPFGDNANTVSEMLAERDFELAAEIRKIANDRVFLRELEI